MLANVKESHVKFISYTGKYPTLCMGVLTLEIDGKKHEFGYNYEENRESEFDSFWCSSGYVDRSYNTVTGEWVIDCEQLPEQFRQYAAEIDEVFNSNVPYGCCGGCI